MSVLDQRLVGAIVAINIANQQGMISEEDLRTLLKCFLYTHDVDAGSKDDGLAIANDADIIAYINLVVEKNKRK
jgi:hypothetical protein